MNEYGMRVPEGTPVKKRFSAGTFFGGFFVGMVCTLSGIALVGWVFVSQVLSGGIAITEDTLKSAGLLDAVQKYVLSQQDVTSAYGEILALGSDTITIETSSSEGAEQFTFRFDSNSEFIQLAPEDGSTELPMNPASLVVGEYLMVMTAENIGTVEDQYLVKAIRY